MFDLLQFLEFVIATIPFLVIINTSAGAVAGYLFAISCKERNSNRGTGKANVSNIMRGE